MRDWYTRSEHALRGPRVRWSLDIPESAKRTALCSPRWSASRASTQPWVRIERRIEPAKRAARSTVMGESRPFHGLTSQGPYPTVALVRDERALHRGPHRAA